MSKTKSPEIPGGEIRHALETLYNPLNEPDVGSVSPSFERGCSCPDCNRHLNRLEEFNAQLAWECDRLRQELAERRVA